MPLACPARPGDRVAPLETVRAPPMVPAPLRLPPLTATLPVVVARKRSSPPVLVIVCRVWLPPRVNRPLV